MPTTSTTIVKRPRFVEVAPASRHISARHCLHNVSEPQAAESPAPEPSLAEHPAAPEEPAPPSEPKVGPAPESEDYVPPMVITDSSNPGAFTDEPAPAIAEEPKPAPDAPAPEEPQPQRAVDQPTQGPAPAVDEAAYLDLVPAASLQHARAQDAPAEPVAEANVHRAEGAEVPQPRQWADEGGWFLLLQPSRECPIAVVDHDRAAEVERRDVDGGGGISSIPMHARNPHGSSTALRAALMPPICPRDWDGALCAFYRASACLGTPRNPYARARRRGDRERGFRRIVWTRLRALGGRDAREGQRVRSLQVGTFISSIAMGKNTRPDLLVEFAPSGYRAQSPYFLPALRLRYRGESADALVARRIEDAHSPSGGGTHSVARRCRPRTTKPVFNMQLRKSGALLANFLVTKLQKSALRFNRVKLLPQIFNVGSPQFSLHRASVLFKPEDAAATRILQPLHFAQSTSVAHF
ncbi:hypothetical protein FB451DRAFT_1376689 [Mycena latifolia]|nr:hypothetical protein FB451DRAFT_1376689 [Mycena latifolia]